MGTNDPEKASDLPKATQHSCGEWDDTVRLSFSAHNTPEKPSQGPRVLIPRAPENPRPVWEPHSWTHCLRASGLLASNG